MCCGEFGEEAMHVPPLAIIDFLRTEKHIKIPLVISENQIMAQRNPQVS
jgi:hypothetical protein